MVKLPRFTLPLRQLRPAVGAAATFLLSAAQLHGAFAPCALACVAAAGPKLPGFLALLGAAGGAFAFFDFQPGLRFLASAVLLFCVNTAFYDTRLYARRHFRPASAAAVSLLVQLLWLVGRPPEQLLVFALSLAVLWYACGCLAPLLRGEALRSEGRLLLGLCLCAALAPLSHSSGFSPGRALLSTVLLHGTALLTPAQSGLVGLLAGLAMDLVPPRPQLLFTALAGCSCALAAAVRHRWLSAGLYCAGTAAAALLFGADRPAVLLWEAAAGAALHLMLPRPAAAPAARESLPPSPLQARLERSAAAFRDLYDSFFRGTENPGAENPSVLFDRTAQQVCRQCVLRDTCWQQEYSATYNAFNDACPALLRRGQALAQDFPLYFTSRCVHIRDFLAALNTELRAYLLRRQYRLRLLDVRRRAQEQYAQLGELLSVTADAAPECPAPLGYQLGSVLRPREGCRVCGDQLAAFEVGSTLYLLLSDGMGSGETAHREAAMTVRLLRQFLEAGIDPAPALRTLNSAMALRGESGGGYTTIDLLALQRSSGSAVLYKYGAAPSYLKRSGTVTRFTAASLPAGLQGDRDGTPPCSRFALSGGSYFVMVSDGIADSADDEWLQNLLAGWSGGTAAALTALILHESCSRKGLSDDCAVLAIHLPLPPGGKTAV